MFTVRQTREFQDWLDELKDKKAQLRIVTRLLAGGDKSSQARDVKRAQKILHQLELE
jgi:putative component of toxin-antitoxin plasmid stabilization module